MTDTPENVLPETVTESEPQSYFAFLQSGPSPSRKTSIPLPADGRPVTTYTDPVDGATYELDLSVTTHGRGARNMPTYRFVKPAETAE